MRHIYGCHENFRESLTTLTASFPDILMDFCSDRPNAIDPWMCVQNSDVHCESFNVPAKFEVRKFTRSWDSDWSFGRPCQSRERGHRWSGMVPSEIAFLYSRPSIVTFPVSLRVTCFVLHLIFPAPTLSLFNISAMFGETRWMAFGLRRARCWANCPCS